MQTQTPATCTSFADATATAETDETLESFETVETSEQDPAGGIVLTGRNKVGARVRVLAGLVLTTGIVAAMGALDTTSSAAVSGHVL